MTVISILILLLVTLVKGIVIQGSGTPTLVNLFQNWFSAYSLLRPDVQFNYTITSQAAAASGIINGTPPSDFCFIESIRPTLIDQQINPNFQMLPLLASTLWLQVNIPSISLSPIPLVLTRDVVARIYMGNITNWRDPDILFTNPSLNKTLPNANISVVYFLGISGGTISWTSILSSFSATWKSIYGVRNLFPANLSALPNFYPANGALYVNSLVLSLNNSIGMVSPIMITRDKQIQYPCLVNIMNNTVCPSGRTVQASINRTTIHKFYLTNNLTANVYGLDPPYPNAYPSSNYVALLVSTKPTDARCEATVEFYKFLRWVFSDKVASNLIEQVGLAPLSQNIIDETLAVIDKIQCEGKSVLTVQIVNERGDMHTVLVALASLVLVFVALLGAFHLYFFRTYINLVYTTIFVTGSFITLISPFFWYMVPTTDAICRSRVWLSSVGLSILLGTMFSRTWQLRDIYLLTKKKDLTMSRDITIRSSLIKLAVTLCTVISINLLIVLIWTAVDPYRAIFRVEDELLRQGRWSCTSNYLSTWLDLELAFLLCLIFFGVYVIYLSWSFQKQASVSETRWVLFALYNILLNLTAVIPLAIIAPTHDDFLSAMMMVSIIFSGGGIVLAFLLPRSIQKILYPSTKDSGSAIGTPGTKSGSVPGTPAVAKRAKKDPKEKEKETSRTPAEELGLRLEAPQPNYRKFTTPDDTPISEARGLVIKESHQEVELLEMKRQDIERQESANSTASELDDSGHDVIGLNKSGKHMLSLEEGPEPDEGRESPSPLDHSMVGDPSGRNQQLNWSTNPLSTAN